MRDGRFVVVLQGAYEKKDYAKLFPPTMKKEDFYNTIALLIPEDRNPKITRVGEHVYLFMCDEGGHFFCFADQPDFEPPKEYYEEIFSCQAGGVRC